MKYAVDTETEKPVKRVVAKIYANGHIEVRITPDANETTSLDRFTSRDYKRLLMAIAKGHRDYRKQVLLASRLAQAAMTTQTSQPVFPIPTADAVS